jgi:hypothetical protein
MQERKKEKEKEQYEINLVLDQKRYNNLLDLCKKYAADHSVNLTPKDYIFFLLDSAITSVYGSKGE